MTTEERKALRNALADYMQSEGCSCCRNQESHDEAEKRLAALLRVPQYSDASGFDFRKFATPREAR